MRNRRQKAEGRRQKRRGSILIVTMIVVFALAAMVLVLGRSMRVEMQASANVASQAQAECIEHGAEQYVMGILGQQIGSIPSLTDDYYEAVPLGDGYFWILRPNYGDPDMSAFGLMDESGKLNINYGGTTKDSLMKLPNMTDDVAAAMIDWRDVDSDESTGGAENTYYSNLRPTPYNCKNAPFESIEEMLLVRGVTKQLLYGNGTAPPLGQRDASVFNNNSSSGLMTDLQTARGIADLLTVQSREYSRAADGTNRQSINDRGDTRSVLRSKLGRTRGDEIAATIPGNKRFVDIFDFYFFTKMKLDEFSRVSDYLTGNPFSSRGRINGLVNVNTAPREVLLCLGNLDSNDVDKLMNRRKSVAQGDTSIAWVADALGVKAIGIGNLVTGRPSRVSADIVAVSGDGRSFKRVKIIVSTGGNEPHLMYRRDLTDHGWPMDPRILDSLRNGKGPQADALAGMGAH